ncbi:hypothetical protein TNCV_343391 [Trichonephila clavipes]|nr:hypothetical protein TNCV_343391 [Trichonephila clavipes]
MHETLFHQTIFDKEQRKHGMTYFKSNPFTIPKGNTITVYKTDRYRHKGMAHRDSGVAISSRRKASIPQGSVQSPVQKKDYGRRRRFNLTPFDEQIVRT